MFKLESYITPILLSYVDRYIKNFRLEDSQVSLWGGDATFHNLDLRLEVLEQELQLPFSFVSGHIRELLIHVPWTKLASEPITITINTIECILKLREADAAASDTPSQSREKPKKSAGHRQEVEAPPGYVQLLINKIVSNIRIYCNNLILKYVEEDIVLSMNVKHLKFESANEKWEPAYTDISPAQVILRKVISVNDLTLCLDKRNAAGKIDVYQEPMLYKCSMTMHLLRLYHSATASRASTTRLDIYCNSMEFSMTEQQVPMLIRLLMLLYALQQKDLKPETDIQPDASNIPAEFKESADNPESWTGWAWSYVSSVLPSPWDEEWNNEQLKNQSGHTFHFGLFVDNASVTFKVSESSAEKSAYYSHKKIRYWPLITLQLQGIYCETIVHGITWVNSSFGISEAILLPLGPCSCSHMETIEGADPLPYLKLGASTNLHKSDSLFDAEAVENKGQKRQYNTSWDYHMTAHSESVLLERTPACAFDFVYQMEIPSDMTSDMLSDLGSDYEFSNLSETSCMRLCFGPCKLRICSGFFHRLSSLQVAASAYDYSPYSIPKPSPSFQELMPPSEEDFDALNEFISSRTMRITFFAPVVELQLMDHPYFVATKGTMFRKRKKISATTISFPKPSELPKLTIECQFIDISIKNPMYVNRLVHTTCQLPDPPKQLFDACFTQRNIKILGLCSRLILNPHRHTTILSPSSASYSYKSILKPFYWTNPDIPHEEIVFESESITINGTNAKMMVIAQIIEKMYKMEPEGALNSISYSSLMHDAAKDTGMPYLELCIEAIRFQKVTTISTVSIDISFGSIKAFIFEPLNKAGPTRDTAGSREVKADFGINFAQKDIQQVLFISGPEPKKYKKTEKMKEIMEDAPLFVATLQYPINPDMQKHPPILVFNMQEIRICIDPLLCRWLLYKPKNLGVPHDGFDPAHHKNKSLSEASGSVIETPRRLSTQLESVHSSSDREQLYIPQRLPKVKEDNVDMQEKIYNFLKTWFDVWKGMLFYGDISQCTIYFPMESLSAIGSQGIQEAIEEAVNKDFPPDIMVITLPFANIRSAQRQSIAKYIKELPVTLPSSIWSIDKSSFPWTMSISDLSCYSIQYGNKLTFLKPVSLSATVGLSTRPSKTDTKETTSDDLQSASSSTKIDIGCLGVCIHIDMTPVVISTSEVQVCLFASILYGLMEVISNIMPERPKTAPKTPDLPTPVVVPKGSSTLSPTIIRENTMESSSEQSPPIINAAADVESDNVKLTAWVQWTITRFTIELLSNEYVENYEDDVDSLQPRLKLVIDAEDIVSSLDFQSVYLKIKSKIGSVSIQHYKRDSPNSKWKPGPFLGIVMRLREDVATDQRHEDNGFISITITRASCQHTHTLWGAVQKGRKDKKANPSNTQLFSPSKYITEIVVNVQPIDFVISLKTLRSFYLIIVPLLQIPMTQEKSHKDSNFLSHLNNQTLPLAYLDCQDIRVIMPSVELGGSGALHDVCMFQVHKISLSPSAVNPICRAPIRPDIYEQAANARILSIPGSEVEDRQYQLDVIGLSMSTGTWEDLDSVFSPSGSALSTLHGVSENPAVEWNNLEQGQPNMAPILNLWQVTEKFDISIVAAPAMIYQDNIIVCGHSVEVNFVSDIIVNLCLHQIKLVSALCKEFILLLEPILQEEGLLKRPKIKFPYSHFEMTHYELDEEGGSEVYRDSGIDTSDMKSVLSSKIPAIFSAARLTSEPEKSHIFPRPPNPIPHAYTSIPIEILFTGGHIILSLYQMDNPKSHIKLKGKRKKISRKTDDDQGYDASEESVDERNDTYKKYIPLLYLCINQPNAFLSKHQLGKRIQISCFDVCMKLSGPEYLPVGHLPTDQDYPVRLIDTRSGEPDPVTGILPAFFTMRFTKGLGKNASLEFEFAKPTKILCSTNKWSYLLKVKDKVLDAFRGSELFAVNNEVSAFSVKTSMQSAVSNLPETYPRNMKHGENYARFQEIKQYLHGANSVSVRFDQIILAFKSDTGHELNIGLGKLKTQLTVSNRPEKLTNSSSLDCITLTVINDDFKQLLLNPWSISMEVCIFWESWQNTESDPQIQISAESDCIMLEISPKQLNCIEMVIKDLEEFFSNIGVSEAASCDSFVELQRAKPLEKDQHYKDDLRAGAFQFVDANTNNTDELPLPYQVMFWTKNISAMAWRYPQPRALTKVRIFPVPYKIALGSPDEDFKALCHLEYWSELRNCYLPYTQFYLSESEVCHLTLPEACPQPIVASTWRVVITMVTEQENSQLSGLISPRALAACMRIDSYFNKCLVPNITAALYITKIDVSLYSHLFKNNSTKLPETLKNFTPDWLFPENHCFLTLTWESLTAYGTSWDLDTISAEVSSSAKCSVLDYTFLTEQTFIEPFTSKLEINFCNTLCCNFISKPIQIKVGPNIAHTLAVSGQLWSQNHKQCTCELDFIIVTRYVICNDTNANVRFGQYSTDEDILLSPKSCHLYCWRSQKHKQQLKIAVEENEWLWSKPFSVAEDGIRPVVLSSDRNLTVLVNVKSLSATQKQILISGQLVVANMLLEHFELKVVAAVNEDKEAEFRKTPTYIVPGKTCTPSLFMNSKKIYFLRLRFYGLDSAWTGDIPLREHATGCQPWLVKDHCRDLPQQNGAPDVFTKCAFWLKPMSNRKALMFPLQERGQFLSIWCRIVIQDVQKVKKVLAMLWPLFMVRSSLPISVKVHIETPTLNVKLESCVKGKGELQQLYCPGTIDHSHQLTFQLDNGTQASNPYVPLNYSLVDQQQFFKRNDKEDIEEILSVINAYAESKWPYFDELDEVECVVDEQPLTHVQVRYQNACQYSSALLVELLPWSLLVNTLGTQVALMVNNSELCRIQHHGIVAPPKIEENFNLGVCIGGSWFFSEPLQLAKSNWSQSFYMPKFSGTIPVDGNIKTPIQCDSHICMISITSCITNEMRLLKLSSTHVLANYVPMQMQVVCLAVPETAEAIEFPTNLEQYSFTVAPHQQKSQLGISIIQWYALGKENELSNCDYALYICFSVKPKVGWSCPIRIDKTLTRQSFCVLSEDFPIPIVLTSQEHKGQIYLAVHNDARPQLFIENKSGITLFCAQTLTDNKSVVAESQHFKWNRRVENNSCVYYTMPAICRSFPELPQTNFSENIVFAAEPDNVEDLLDWSSIINIADDNQQFLRIPFYGDVKIIVVNTACTTFLTIESVSEVEFSARDIRVRLSMHELESDSSFKVAKRSSEEYERPVKVCSSEVTTFYSVENLQRSTSDPVLTIASKQHQEPPSFQKLPTVTEQSNLRIATDIKRPYSEVNLHSDISRSKSMLVYTLPMRQKWNSVKASVFIKSFILTFVSDLEKDGVEQYEVANATFDNIACTVKQAVEMQVKFSISSIQFDNQLYTRQSFDFPVVLIGQLTSPKEKLNSINVPIGSLIEDRDENVLLLVEIDFETCRNPVNDTKCTGVKNLKINVKPLSCFVEDIYVTKLMEYLSVFMPTNLITWPARKGKAKHIFRSGSVGIPEIVSWQCAMYSNPLTIRYISVSPVSVLLSVHSSIKLYIALDQSPLYFNKFERRRICTTPYRLGHALTMHYLSGAIFGAGWVVSSLELLGSPGGLARAMGTGLRDFVSLPYRGLLQGPMAFLVGVTHGSASLMKHVTAGTLHSVTKLASSVARNLDRLTMDEEHLRRTEEQRRQRPQGLAQGFMQGLTGFGISLLGAVGGIAHHPIQSVMSEGASPRSLAAGVGLGIVGVITKPLSGAAELVALTGQGLLQGAGWNSLPEIRTNPVLYLTYSSANSILKYKWKLMNSVAHAQLLFVTEATAISNNSHHDTVALILTNEALVMINLDNDQTQRIISLSELSAVQTGDPNILTFKMTPPLVQAKSEDECVVEMDPACRARVADYVRSTVGLLNLPDNFSLDHSELSISPLSSPRASPTETSRESTTLTYYVNPQSKNYFLCLLSLAKQQSHNYKFPVL